MEPLEESEYREILSLTKKRWEGVSRLGKGGQGQAFVVRTADARKRRP
jgi:hypothetical protein